MPSIEGIRLKIRRKYIQLTSNIRLKSINKTDFTIISNNCWAGFIYQSYGIRYNTPTVGLFFMPNDYLKFISKLEYYIKSNLEFINPNESKYYDELRKDPRFGSYPIGKIYDIEIMFLHYKTEHEAYRKWNERCERINWNRLVFKFNDQNGCTENHLNSFEKLKLKNKICFTSKKYGDLKSSIFIKSAKNQEYIYASQEPFGKSRYVNITNFLNEV